MNAVTEYFMAKKRAMEAQAKALEIGLKIKPKYEYDSDEDTEGGTWEHKRRMVFIRYFFLISTKILLFRMKCKRQPNGLKNYR